MTALLILGSKVRGNAPGRVLESRLRKALPLAHSARPVVVSGAGEAGVMRDWLVAHGVAPGSITMEPGATSTNENLENAHRLFPEVREWTVVTSEFHVPRTYLWAWHLGLRVRVVPAATPGVVRLQMFARECLALPHTASRVVWRKLRS